MKVKFSEKCLNLLEVSFFVAYMRPCSVMNWMKANWMRVSSGGSLVLKRKAMSSKLESGTSSDSRVYSKFRCFPTRPLLKIRRTDVISTPRRQPTNKIQLGHPFLVALPAGRSGGSVCRFNLSLELPFPFPSIADSFMNYINYTSF